MTYSAAELPVHSFRIGSLKSLYLTKTLCLSTPKIALILQQAELLVSMFNTVSHS